MIKTRLHFAGVSDIIGNDDISLLVLADLDGKRQISVVCGSDTARLIQMRCCNGINTDMFLPEVLCRLFDLKSRKDIEIIVDSIKDGQYKAHLTGNGDNFPIDVRISDAVLLSVVADVPLFMENELLRRQSVEYSLSSKRVPVPINTVSNEMLDEALEQAIANENYELASYISSEKKRRGMKG